MSTMFAQILFVGAAVGLTVAGSTLFAQLVGRKMRTEKPVDHRGGARDLRTW